MSLKPCPFCANEAVAPVGYVGDWSVVCPTCLTRGPSVHNGGLAMTHWNQRADSPEVAKLRAENASLKALNDSLAERVAAQSELLTKKAERGDLEGGTL